MTPPVEFYKQIDPDTGILTCLVENLESDNPCLKQRDGRFRVAMLRFDGGVHVWVSHLDKGVWGVDPGGPLGDLPLHSRVEALKLMTDMQDGGWIPRAFAESEDLTELLAYTAAACAKTGKAKCDLIAKHSQAIFGKELTGEQVWAALPKELMLLQLAEWYSVAVQLHMREAA